jgi:hypothetical protein
MKCRSISCSCDARRRAADAADLGADDPLPTRRVGGLACLAPCRQHLSAGCHMSRLAPSMLTSLSTPRHRPVCTGAFATQSKEGGR